jgi:hypothetical protein
MVSVDTYMTLSICYECKKPIIGNIYYIAHVNNIDITICSKDYNIHEHYYHSISNCIIKCEVIKHD